MNGLVNKGSMIDCSMDWNLSGIKYLFKSRYLKKGAKRWEVVVREDHPFS